MDRKNLNYGPFLNGGWMIFKDGNPLQRYNKFFIYANFLAVKNEENK